MSKQKHGPLAVLIFLVSALLASACGEEAPGDDAPTTVASGLAVQAADGLDEDDASSPGEVTEAEVEEPLITIELDCGVDPETLFCGRDFICRPRCLYDPDCKLLPSCSGFDPDPVVAPGIIKCDFYPDACDVALRGMNTPCFCDPDCGPGVHSCSSDGTCDAWCPQYYDPDCGDGPSGICHPGKYGCGYLTNDCLYPQTLLDVPDPD